LKRGRAHYSACPFLLACCQINTGANIGRNFIGSAYIPNGGYYYGRITFNF
jgi:hypothetical protein